MRNKTKGVSYHACSHAIHVLSLAFTVQSDPFSCVMATLTGKQQGKQLGSGQDWLSQGWPPALGGLSEGRRGVIRGV